MARTLRDPPKLAARLALFAALQLLVILHATKLIEYFNATDDDSISMLWSNDGTIDYDCFPPRRGSRRRDEENNATIVYLETAYVNLHYETYYSFIHRLCSCDEDKDPHWTIDTDKIPHFYVGPKEMLTVGFEKILTEYNATTCGPIFFGEPKGPDLTVVTTSYPGDFKPGSKRGYGELINDERYIFICHEDGPFLEENATNVFFLTPLHTRYIVPSFFPPTIIQRHSKSIRKQHPEKPPIFLVLGGFNNRYRRNVDSLAYPLKYHRDENFTVRFLGGTSNAASNDALRQSLYSKFPKEDHDKIELLPRTDSYEFMLRVSESDVVLPLVEGGSFYHEKGYQGGKKLTSSVMWGLGFGKKMLMYRPLAEVFGIEEDNETIFLHGDSTSETPAQFFEGFGRCLEYVLAHR